MPELLESMDSRNAGSFEILQSQHSVGKLPEMPELSKIPKSWIILCPAAPDPSSATVLCGGTAQRVYLLSAWLPD